MKWNSEHLFELAALEIISIWNMQYLFWYWLSTTVYKLNSFNIWYSNFNFKVICLASLDEGASKICFLLTLLQKIYSYFSFHLPAMQLISPWRKSYKHIYHSPPHVSVVTGNTLITIIRFARYYLLLVSNSTFMTDSKYLSTIQI